MSEVNRSQIEEKYKWDLSSLCTSDEDFYDKLEKSKTFLPKLKTFEGKLNNKEAIYDYLMLEEELDKIIEPAHQYCFLKSSEDLSEEKYNEMSEKLSTFGSQLAYETSFAISEIYELDDKLLDDIIKDEKFKDYDRFFEHVKRDKKHILSKAEEKLIAGMDFLGSQDEVMSKLSDVDFDFGEIEDSSGKKYHLSQSNYGKFMRHEDRKLREGAFKGINGKFGQYINGLSANYISHIKEDCYFAKVRNYKNALSSALEGEEIEPKIYDKLIEMVNKNLPLLFDYFSIKQKELNLKDFYIYDAMASTEKGDAKSYTFEEAMEIIKKALSPLGDEYLKLLDKAVAERWIDVFPNKNKHSGAYQSGIYGYNPFVLTNFEGDLDGVFTLAHELGHAMHSVYSNEKQPRQKASHPIFLAEIASITNEILLLNYLLANAKSSDEKKNLYNKFFDEVKSTIFRQTMFAEFEEKVHALHEAGEGLTKEKLCNTYYNLNEKYFGYVKLTPETAYEWARIPHFFESFYVYKYATGMIASICFANRILSNKADALEGYFKFLSAGCSEKPISLLKKCGCNFEDGSAFDDCFEYLENMLNEWKKLI